MKGAEDHPCNANMFGFPYDNSKTPKENAKKLADYTKEVDKACGGGSVDVTGYCAGGQILCEAIEHMNGNGVDYDLDFFNTPFQGGFNGWGGAHYAYTLGLWNGGLSVAQYYALHCNSDSADPGSNIRSVDVWVGQGDGWIPDGSQAAGPKGSDVHTDPDGDHTSTMPKNFEYDDCCGDGVVTSPEECDIEDPNRPFDTCEQYNLPPWPPLGIPGTCNEKCECIVDTSSKCGNGELDLKEQCDSSVDRSKWVDTCARLLSVNKKWVDCSECGCVLLGRPDQEQ